ncbi:nitroreductase [Phenylobacterium sp.]|uniref:nitroreductase family protein n=1 Tax=Phenylobacterium sp. TaxID=1871053 RepID=UPI0025F69FC3|nr:nitroreductase [Phenylobacterium sp.]MBX3484823.1 nitroreductase [Phenylobacterium sp.]MCW5759384.1 nitroreductase [Phenylobacterium sp.]
MTELPPPPQLGDPLPPAASPEVLRFLALRRSTPALTLAEPAPSDAEVTELIRLAARVPDHGKLAPWRFIVLGAAAKADVVARLEALAQAKGDPVLTAKLGKLRVPPLAVVVVSTPNPAASIPEWEQLLSAGAVCTNLLYGALAMGYGANWITDWYSYDAEATALLGLQAGERVAGVMLMGTPREPPLERDRPALEPLTTRWAP